MKRILFVFMFLLVFLSAIAQNRPSIQIKYRQTIEGQGTKWIVRGIFIPYGNVKNGDLLEIGDVELTFIDIENVQHRMTFSGSRFSDKGLYLNQKYQEGEIISLDLITKSKDRMLSYDSPFFFSDVDLDGEEELLITEWRGGAKSSNRYIAYDLDGSKQMKCEPFIDGIEDEFFNWNLERMQVVVTDVLDGDSVLHRSIYSLEGNMPILIKD